MADVVDANIWNQKVAHFKDFAILMDAQFNTRRLPDGKEYVVVEQWFNPKREVRDGSKS